jgi:hypothetical protein|nr:MAG TPA: restriction alleviation protein [Caudoviricetes sp.]DAR75205.1 MAG TPA: restriction alleviation protein [Caudoviricetes sp.]
MEELKRCPFCGKNAVYIGVCDDEGNFHGRLGCEYEQDPWSGLSYDLHHEGWGKCILCTDGDNQSMGGVLFDTAEDAIEAWNKRYKED